MPIAKERHRFEVHATGTQPIFVLTNFGFPVNVIQVATRSRVVRLWRFLFPRRLDALGPCQRVASANVEIVALTVLANALSGRNIQTNAVCRSLWESSHVVVAEADRYHASIPDVMLRGLLGGFVEIPTQLPDRRLLLYRENEQALGRTPPRSIAVGASGPSARELFPRTN